MKKDWGMGKDEDSKTRKGEKDYTAKREAPGEDLRKGAEKRGAEGTKKKDGDDAYVGDKHHDKKKGEHHDKESMADYLAKEARDGPHLLELLEENNWEIREKDGKTVVTDEQIEEELGMNRKAPNISVIRLRAARNALGE